VLDRLNGREAAALLVDGRLDDLLVDGDGPRPGAVFRAVVDRGLKGQGGAILRLPGGLSAWLRQAQGLRAGQTLVIQVTGAAEPGKAVPVTDRLLVKTRLVIATPGAPGLNISRQIRDEAERARLLALAGAAQEGAVGLILRSAAAGAPAAELAEEARAASRLAARLAAAAEGSPELLLEGCGPHALARREWQAAEWIARQGAFDREGVSDQVEALRRPDLALGEGRMTIEPTRALVAVDVDTGGDASPAAALKANLAAARALPRQLRLRGLGGQVAVDFVTMPKAQRRQLEQSLRDAFRLDPVETSLLGWTAMGLFELTRKRERLPLLPLLGGG
jgi:Ribonuclease G/E